MAISSTPTGYSNGCTGRLAAAITTTTSTGITVTADTVKSPAGTGAVTWTTGNQIWKISRKTRTNTEVEYIGVESLSQSGILGPKGNFPFQPGGGPGWGS